MVFLKSIINSQLSTLNCHNLRRTGQHALAALQAVGVQVAGSLTAGIVGRKLHGADAGTALALHLTGTLYMDVGERLGQRSLFRCHPTGDGSHRTERAPGTGCIDERKYHAHDGGHDDNGPEHLADVSPHGQTALAPGYEAQLDAEHTEDEEHHEQAEAEGANKPGNRTVG